jgi:hypothetical protein
MRANILIAMRKIQTAACGQHGDVRLPRRNDAAKLRGLWLYCPRNPEWLAVLVEYYF